MQIPRAAYGLAMFGATILAFGAAYLVTLQLGGNPASTRAVLIAMGLGSFATFVPVVLSIDKEHWGLAVVVCGVARALIVLGYCYAIRETDPDVVARPLFLGGVAGAMLLLLAEAVASIKVLSVLERRRVAVRASSESLNREPA